MPRRRKEKKKSEVNEKAKGLKQEEMAGRIGTTRPRPDLPSPLEIASHAACYRKVPWSCRILWNRAVNAILQKYKHASLERNRDEQVEAVISLLGLPEQVLA